MRSIGKAIRAANTQHKCWRHDMYAFLRNYGATSYATTNQSPAELFNIKIPTSPVKSKSKISHSKAKIMDKNRKRKMRTNAKTPNRQSYTFEIMYL